MASAYAAIARPRAVINVDQPLKLADFKAALTQLEPMLRADEASFQAAIDMVFASMVGPLPADEAARVGALRRARQDVVLGIWGTVFESSAAELDATVEALVGAVTVPYLSLHGIDPGEAYTTWLRRLMPSATVEVWPDQGHYPHLVQPIRFLERVSDFDHCAEAPLRRARHQTAIAATVASSTRNRSAGATPRGRDHDGHRSRRSCRSTRTSRRSPSASRFFWPNGLMPPTT